MQASGGPAARGCRQLEVTARGCRQLEVSPLEAAGRWRSRHSWKQATGGPAARGCSQLEVPPHAAGGPAARDWVGSFGKCSCSLPEFPLIFPRLPRPPAG
eukprot:gene21956-biopygen20701